MEKKKPKTEPDDAFSELLARVEQGESEPSTTTEEAEKGASETADADAPKAEATTADAEKTERHKREERARRAFKHLTDIDEEGESAMSLRGILGGDILGGRAFRRQFLYILMLCAMAIIYVANRYACQREEIRREELARDLADRKFKALTVAAELTEYSMRSNVEENLPDSTLRTSTKASYFLQVEESDTLTDKSD